MSVARQRQTSGELRAWIRLCGPGSDETQDARQGDVAAYLGRHWTDGGQGPAPLREWRGGWQPIPGQVWLHGVDLGASYQAANGGPRRPGPGEFRLGAQLGSMGAEVRELLAVPLPGTDRGRALSSDQVGQWLQSLIDDIEAETAAEETSTEDRSTDDTAGAPDPLRGSELISTRWHPSPGGQGEPLASQLPASELAMLRDLFVELPEHPDAVLRQLIILR